jgi:hypothetical protein
VHPPNRVSAGEIATTDMTKGVKTVTRKFLILVGFALALVMPSAALAGGDWGGFDSDALKANIQSSIQAASVEQSGASFGGDASANGGSHNDASAWAGNGGNANSGVQGASQTNGNGTTVSTGDSSTGSIDGGNTVSLGNQGGSVSNGNETSVGVDATNVAKSGDAEGANGGLAVPVNVNHEGDNTSVGGDASNSNGNQRSNGGDSATAATLARPAEPVGPRPAVLQSRSPRPSATTAERAARAPVAPAPVARVATVAPLWPPPCLSSLRATVSWRRSIATPRAVTQTVVQVLRGPALPGPVALAAPLTTTPRTVRPTLRRPAAPVATRARLVATPAAVATVA